MAWLQITRSVRASVRKITKALVQGRDRRRTLSRPQCRAPFLELRASHISDPLERLKFLRYQQVARARARWRLPRPAIVLASALLCLVAVIPFPIISDARPTPIRPNLAMRPPIEESGAFPQVWPIEKAADHETFSNGLRVENRYVAEAKPRGAFRVFPAEDPQAQMGTLLTAPAGIVFHTTESDELPFDPSENRTLQRVSAELLSFVRRHRSYHFLIDRFGRAFRIVPESDVAFHAGESAWADHRYLYLDLNRSFLGVAFETRTRPGEDTAGLTAAQIGTARELTEMLRSRYRIEAADCVTHAQVSLNPGHELLGWHTDFGASFPFTAAGLPDNYALPPAALYLLGFRYDSAFRQATGPRIEKGLTMADSLVESKATALGLSPGRYRGLLRRRYRDVLARERAGSPIEELQNEN